MFDIVRRHKDTLFSTAGLVGGAYVARNYLRDRLDDVKCDMETERVAKEILKRRFRQTQEDTSYTTMALLPTLSEQVLQTMDVESITAELQARSRARTAARHPAPAARPSSSLSSAPDDARSELSNSDDLSKTSSHLSESFASASGSVSKSWIDSTRDSSRSPAPSASAASSGPDASEAGSGQLSESILSVASTTTSSAVSDSSDTRSKAELWNEVKILTFTRTLTTVYSATLLSLFTTLQLTLLARAKYVAAVRQNEREERLRERLEAQFSATNLILGGIGLGLGASTSLEKLLSGGGLDLGEDEEEGNDAGALNEEVENKFLTLSWWLLHVGWKDVGERVRRAVEEAFDGVSLKTKLSAVDLHRLIRDVRRRVEHEITFEGTERKTNFLSSLLPPTPETIQHVLTQGGFTSSSLPALEDLSDSQALSSSQLSHSFYDSPATAIGKSTNATSTPSPYLPSSTPRHREPWLKTQPHPPTPNSEIDPLEPKFPSLHPEPHASTSSHSQPHSHLLDPPFLSLITEARTILLSPDFDHVLEVALDKATEVLMDGVERNVFQALSASNSTSGGPSTSTSASIPTELRGVEEIRTQGVITQELEDPRIRLAALLPGLARWSQLAFDGFPNELTDNILALRETTCLSAIVFSKFEEQFW